MVLWGSVRLAFGRLYAFAPQTPLHLRNRCSKFAQGNSCTLAAPLAGSKIDDGQPACEVAAMH